jgi:hypothetical protein
LTLSYGNTPVPFTASWSGEERTFVGRCRFAKCEAICQDEAPGTGQPIFARPHFVRQRQVIVQELCDLCGKPLRARTRVSLSHAAPRQNGARAFDILQVEPLLHKDCAAVCLKFCPSLKRDISAGTLRVRQVLRSAVQFAISAPQFVGEYVPGYAAGPEERIVAHAKVQLLDWRDRDAAWLGA